MIIALTEFEIQMIHGFYSPVTFRQIENPSDLNCDKLGEIFTTHRTRPEEMIMLWDTCFDKLNISQDLHL